MSVTEQDEAGRLVIGWHEFQMDRKGRLVLPVEWRYSIGLPFALVPAPEGRLYGVRADDWLRLVHLHCYRDYYLSGSAIISMIDWSTSRFQVPYYLRDHAGLKPGAVAMVGLGDAFQIAPADRWRDEKTALELRMEFGALLTVEDR